VSCPTGITAKKGVRFTCAVRAADGTTGRVAVTGRDAKGSVDLSAPFLSVRKAEADMARQLGAESGDTVKVTCPELLVIRKGVTFLCKATADDQERNVTGKFLDARGRFSFRPD
jgi:hypothetical protein